VRGRFAVPLGVPHGVAEHLGDAQRDVVDEAGPGAVELLDGEPPGLLHGLVVIGQPEP
jgi:hypothetical protein